MMKTNIKKEFPCKIEKLWNIITNNYDYSWRSNISKIEIVDDTHFIEYNKKNYPTYFNITSKKKPREYQFDIQNTNIEGTWTGLLRELPNGKTELNCTEEIKIHHTIMKLLAKPYLKSQQKRYIKDLEKKIRVQKDG